MLNRSIYGWQCNPYVGDHVYCFCLSEYRAIYPYAGDQAGDMALQPGDVVVVMEMLPTGWWRGCVDDREGWFPGSYVEVRLQVTELYR